MKNKKIKLVLSGSGTKYPCFVGAIKKLLEEGYEIEEVCGTSGGALVASGLASYYDSKNPLATIDRLEKFMIDFLPGKLIDWNFLPFFRRGFIGGKKILKALEENLPKSFNDVMRSTPKDDGIKFLIPRKTKFSSPTVVIFSVRAPASKLYNLSADVNANATIAAVNISRRANSVNAFSPRICSKASIVA